MGKGPPNLIYQKRLKGVFITKGKGKKSFYGVKDKDLVLTALYEKNGEVWARGYKLPSNKNAKYRDWEIFNIPIKSTP